MWTVQIGAVPAGFGSSPDRAAMDASFNAATVNSVNEKECGDGYTCSHDGDAYGCVKNYAPPGSPIVCCSAGQSVEACDGTSSPIHPLPFCPFGGATGGGCVRDLKRNSKDSLH